MTSSDAGAAFTALRAAAERADHAMRNFAHVAFHHGEGQLPRTCEWCRDQPTTSTSGQITESNHGT